MLTVDQYEFIRTAYRVYGKKIKEIARQTGHSKNTIKKVLKTEYVEYQSRQKQSYPVLGPYKKSIDKWLANDKGSPKNRGIPEPGFITGLSTKKIIRDHFQQCCIMYKLPGKE